MPALVPLPDLARRRLLRALAFGPIGLAWFDAAAVPTSAAPAAAAQFRPHLWLALDASGGIRLTLRKVEMGQGIHTGLRLLVAEELEVAPADIEIVQSTSDPAFGNLTTGGSFSLAGQWLPLRRVAALARTLLVQAAAKTWGISAEECSARDAAVYWRDRALRYAELVPIAATLPVPALSSIVPKPASAFRRIGRDDAAAHHTPMVRGAATYGIDLRIPDMLCASIARAPAVNATVAAVDAQRAQQIPGVVAVETLAGNRWPALDHVRAGVAVLAKDHWTALRGRRELAVSWDRSRASSQDSAQTMLRLRALAAREGIVCRRAGELPRNGHHTRGLRRVSATITMPYLAHAQLEPLNATAMVTDAGIEVWTGTQRQRRLHDAIVRELGVTGDRVRVHAPLIGGAFGRRLEVDYGLEAVLLAARVKRPVQVLWTREDEFSAGLFRPASAHRLEGWIDRDGRVQGLRHHFAGESVLRQQEPAQIAPDGGDWTMTIALMSFFYRVPNLLFAHTPAEPELPCAWWRGTGATQVQVATECFMDELAAASGQDPLAFRLAHLPPGDTQVFTLSPGNTAPYRAQWMRGVLHAVAEKARWRGPHSGGRAYGIACGFYDCPETYTAAVVEMAGSADQPRITRITVATDCGRVVAPSPARAQVESNAVFAIGAALDQQITVRNGEVQQTGFADYAVPRIDQVPPIDTVFVPSERDPSGLGEPATPVVIAAICNAFAQLSRRPVRELPLLKKAAA
jgi:isoquinoline 1-oxidoreductase beta subunit